MASGSDIEIVVSADTSAAQRELQALSRDVTSFSSSVQQGFGMGAGFAAFNAGLSALSSGFGALKASAIDFNQTIDTARASMGKYFTDTQSLNNSIADLNALAAKTPFAFEGLLTAQQRTIGAARSADELKLNMDAIAVVAANTGRVSTENMERISLALGQVQSKGHLAGGELLQLTEAGVKTNELFEILAKQMGTTTGAIQKMVSEGKISSQDLFQAMRTYAQDPKNRAAMDDLAKTWEGAWSTISDVGRTAIAQTFRPLFDAITTLAVGFADFLQSDDFKTWAEAIRLGFEGAVSGATSFLETLAPIGDTLKIAFQEATSGDFAGAFGTITTSLQSVFVDLGQRFQAFAQGMFGSGADLIGEYANGIISGAADVLQGALDTVASMIASFLIGESPPPEGPLSQIREGGANTIMAWGEGAAGAVDRAIKPATDAIADNIGGLKIAGRDADAAIREIGTAIHDVESQSRDLKYTADDLKDTYDDQIKAIDDQIKSLEKAHDVQRDREKLELNLEEIQLRQAELAAQGDPALRAQLQTRLSQLKTADAERKNREALADAEKDLAGSDKDRLKAKLDAQKLDEQEADLQKRLKDAKGDDKAKIKAQLDELQTRREIAAAEAKEREASSQRRIQDAQSKKDQLTVQQEIDGLVDKSALAEIKTRQEAVKQRKDELTLQEQADKIARDMATGPLKDQRDALIADRDKALEPLKEQLQVLDKQRASLTEQRQEYQNIKSEIAAQTAALRDQATEVKKQQTASAAEAKKQGLGTPEGAPKGGISYALGEETQKAMDKAKEAGANLASSIRDGFTTWITANPLITGATIAGALFGAGEGAAIGASLGSIVPIFGTAVGGLIGAAIGAGVGASVGGTLGSIVQNAIDHALGTMNLRDAAQTFLVQIKTVFDADGVTGVIQFVTDRAGLAITQGVATLAKSLDTWANAFLDWVKPALTDLLAELGTLIDGVTSWIERNAAPIGQQLVDWALEFAGWVQTGGVQLLSKLADLIGQVLAWIGDQTITLAGKLLDWATAFVAWVGPQIPVLLTEFGKMVVALVEWMGDHLGDLLDAIGKWAVAFVEWVGPKIPPLLIELGKLLADLLQWTATVALPAILLKLADWGLAFVEWIGPRIGPLLLELGKLLLSVGDWILLTALPAIVLKLADWGGAFLGWIAKDAIPFLAGKLDVFLAAIGTWIVNSVTGLVESAKALGTALLDGITNGISGALEGFWKWLKENFIDKIPETIRYLLGLDQDTGALALVGERMVEELKIGISNRWPSLEEMWGRLSERLTNTLDGGAVEAYIRIAAAMRGIDPDTAVRVANTEGGVTEWNRKGSFNTGTSYGPFQLHYAGGPDPKAGLGDSFTAKTGKMAYEDPTGAIDYALDEARRHGWGQWYGAAAAGIGDWEGIEGHARGGWVGLHGPELAVLGERGPEYVVPNHALRGGGGWERHEIAITIGGREAERIYVTGRDLAIRRGRG